jgi:hypothetical protein
VTGARTACGNSHRPAQQVFAEGGVCAAAQHQGAALPPAVVWPPGWVIARALCLIGTNGAHLTRDHARSPSPAEQSLFRTPMTRVPCGLDAPGGRRVGPVQHVCQAAAIVPRHSAAAQWQAYSEGSSPSSL